LGQHNPFYVHHIMAKIFLTPIDNYEIDHINRNRYDNRLCNLRYVSSAENKHNMGCLITNKLNEKNISRYRDKFWVRIYRNGVYVFMNWYDSLTDAKQARDNFIASN
jgi:hypothetical protein